MVAPSVGAVPFDPQCVADQESARALKPVSQPLAQGIPAPGVWLVWFRLRIFHVTGVTTGWQDIFFVRITVLESVPKAARPPEGVKGSILIADGGNFGVAVRGLGARVRLAIVAATVAGCSSQERRNEVVRVTARALDQ